MGGKQALEGEPVPCHCCPLPSLEHCTDAPRGWSGEQVALGLLLYLNSGGSRSGVHSHYDAPPGSAFGYSYRGFLNLLQNKYVVVCLA